MTTRIRSAFDAGIVTLTLDRPDQLNAFADDMREQLATRSRRRRARPDAARAGASPALGARSAPAATVRHMVALKQSDARLR